MEYCFEHDCFKVNHQGSMVCPRHEVAAGNGHVTVTNWVSMQAGGRWQPSR